MSEMIIVWVLATGMLAAKLTDSAIPMWIALAALAAIMFNKKGVVS